MTSESLPWKSLESFPARLNLFLVSKSRLTMSWQGKSRASTSSHLSNAFGMAMDQTSFLMKWFPTMTSPVDGEKAFLTLRGRFLSTSLAIRILRQIALVADEPWEASMSSAAFALNSRWDWQVFSLERMRLDKPRLSSRRRALADLDVPTGAGIGWLADNILKFSLQDTSLSDFKASVQQLIPKLARGVFGEVGVLTDADI